MKNNLAKQMTACLLAAGMAAQPAYAAVTDISNVPLGAAAGSGFLPNLLFILDDSGSMASDYNPDYVNDSNACMTTSGGSTACQRGDPPFEAGGAKGFNGVGYDPNFTYLPGLSPNGQPFINPPSGTLTTTAVTPDAYLGGTAVNVTTNITDKRYCNANNVCKRNGADNATGAVTAAGTKDPEGTTLAAGQFPYRANVSSASTINFGLPEMMTTARFARSGSTVTATTIGLYTPSRPSPLTTSDRVYVTTGNNGLNVVCVPVTSVSANGISFTYTAGGSGTIAATNGSYRKCDRGTWTRSGNTVTVTRTGGHFLQSNDLLLIDSDNNNQDKTTAAAITVPLPVAGATTFTYTGSNTGTSSGNVSWVRTGLYNDSGTVNGPAISYSITPVEYCSDVNLTTCKEFISPTGPTVPLPADPFSNAAHVRFCKTQADALAPGAVTGTSIVAPATTATPRCQLKFVNQAGLTQYIFPRYGWFNRDTIAATVTSYGNRLNRSDCPAAPSCTYTEEIQNYAKWYAYYRTRMQMMKTSAGRSFLPFISNPTATPAKPDRLRVGFITINPTTANGSNTVGANVHSSKYLRVDAFNNSAPATQVSNWYGKFYSIIPNQSTPLRLALSRAGWIFAGKLGTGLTGGIPAADDPIQASCQKNYSFLTTDGFWNQGTGQDIAGNPIGNQDNKPDDSAFNSAPAVNPYLGKFFVSRGSGTYDGAVNSATAGTTPGGSGTLADIAMYYYRTDLRGGTDLGNNATGPLTSPSTTPAGGDVSINNVNAKPTSVDFATHQHMNTFTIGLADGLMRYQPTYATDTTSDFFHIANADVGQCFWNGASQTCNWPTPQADGQSALDDLWHAAVNGRGTFYSAVNPNLLSTGLSSALNSLDIDVASAAAAATSSPQVAQGNARAFSTTYQTSTWSGEVFAQGIHPATGEVIVDGPNNGKFWEAHKLLVERVNGNPLAIPPIPPGPKRVLKMLDVTGLRTLKDFDFASLSATLPAAPPLSTERDQFLAKCTPSSMAQCTTLTPAQRLIANNGTALVDFLSGKSTNEGTVFRDRTEQHPVTGAFVNTILGDIVNAQPVAVGAPFLEYENEATDHSYPKTPVLYGDPSNPDSTAFKEVHAKRAGFLLVGANDGFLHAFDQASGTENWAYVPRFLLPNLYQLADFGYPGQHRFYVDGSPEVADVFDTTASQWKTIVVGGMNSGGRGWFALDITSPLDPKALWEFCSSATWCPNDTSGIIHSDPDLGFSYGNPVIGRRDSDGRWVVVLTSGLNNVSPGDGKGYFYILDAITGQILHKVGTGVGDTTNPSGLMKIGGYYPAGLQDPNFTHVFGGDQLGNVWRMDVSMFPKDKLDPDPSPMVPYTGPTSITTGMPYVGRLATLKDKNGRIQPITARPAGTHIGLTRIYYVGTGRYIGNSDLTDAGPGGIAWQQSIYGIRDQLDDDPIYGGAFVARLPSFRDGLLSSKVVEQTLSPSGSNRTISKNPVDWKTQDGFFIDLNPTFPGDLLPGGNSPGERVFLDVRLIFGTLFITSNVPASGGACVAGGTSFQYGLDFRTGGYVGNDATAPSGIYISKFLVGSALEQTSDNSIKALNKSQSGDPLTTDIPIDTSFLGKRFSYRER